MPKRIQTKFNGLYILSADAPLLPELLEYLQKIPVTTDEQFLTVWADMNKENRDLAIRIDQFFESGELAKSLLNCDECFRVPSTLPEQFWIVTKVCSIMGITLLANRIDLKDCNRVKEALLEKTPFRWSRSCYLFGVQLWEMEKKDVVSSPEELRLLFHDALFRERRRLERMRGRAD